MIDCILQSINGYKRISDAWKAMKYTLTLLPFYLNCAPQVNVAPKPVVISLDPTNQDTIEYEEHLSQEEISFKRITAFVTDSFIQISRQYQKPTLEGRIFFDNSNQLFEYHYEPLPFCEADSQKKYPGKITFEYYSNEEVGNKKMSTLTTLTDVAPFGSVDRVELFVDGTVRIPFYANYKAGWKAQQLHEKLFKHIYQILEHHTQSHATWEDFNMGAVIKDEKWQTYKLHHELLQSLLSQEPLTWEELRIFNPCEL